MEAMPFRFKAHAFDHPPEIDFVLCVLSGFNEEAVATRSTSQPDASAAFCC